MKKNTHHHPITDALGHLDEETVLACMSEDTTPRVTAAPRGVYRKLAVAAACLMLTLGVGAAVALPLMRANDPALPADTTADSPTVSTAPLLWHDEPAFVNIQVLSFDTEPAETASPSEGTVSVENSDIFRNKHLLLQFDCAEGETVTITSHDPLTLLSDDIADIITEMKRLEAQAEEEKLIDIDARAALRRRVLRLESEIRSLQYGGDVIVIGDSDIESMLTVDETTYLWSYASGMADYETVEFLIRNESGEITGAGSICIGVRSYLHVDQLRYEVLGSRRYDQPVGEEEAQAYLAALRDTADKAYAAMDFTPLNPNEGYKIAQSLVYGLIPADSASSALMEWDTAGYGSSECDFRWYTFRKIDTPSSIRRFILFSDGSYVEVASESGRAYEVMLRPFRSPGLIEEDYADTCLTLTDGRTMTFTEEPYMDPDLQFERNRWVAQISE